MTASLHAVLLIAECP